MVLTTEHLLISLRCLLLTILEGEGGSFLAPYFSATIFNSSDISHVSGDVESVGELSGVSGDVGEVGMST